MSGNRSLAERGSLPVKGVRGQGERLGERRRQRRRRVRVALSVLFLILCAGVLYELHQPFLRISRVQIFGADPSPAGGQESLSTIALTAMQGSYLWIIPRDSTLFYPEARIRADLLAADPDIAALSIFRNGFDGLTIRIDNRTPIAQWCGLAPTAGVEAYCYMFDASGYIYAALASTTKFINNFTLYAPLVGETLEPLNATIASAEKLPATFDFARQLNTFGSAVSSIVVHDGEVDHHLESGTRVTYVLGQEQNAFNALTSARASLNLADGSIEYADLRFDGKVYLKRR